MELYQYNDLIRRSHRLETLLDLFYNEHIIVSLGIEIEFYLCQNNLNSCVNIENIKNLINQITTIKVDIKPERGKNQYEIITCPYKLNSSYSLDIEYIRIKKFIQDCEKIITFLKSYGAILFPRPFENDYRNGMHINISLFDINKKCYINRVDLKKLCELVCLDMYKALWAFINTQECIERISISSYDKASYLHNHFMVPTHICYGVNNRYSLFRLAGDINIIEFRLANNNLKLYLGLYCLLKLIYKAVISNKIANKNYVSSERKYEIFGYPNNSVPSIPTDLRIIRNNFSIDLNL